MTRQYLHTNEQKQDMCLKIIRSLRHHDTFTVKMVAQATGLGSMIDAKFVRLLQDIGSVHTVRRKGSQVYYAFDDRAAENAKSEFLGYVTAILKRWCWLIIGCRDCAVPELSHRTFLAHGRAVRAMTKSTGVHASQTLSMQNSVTLRALSGLRRSCWQRGKYRHEPISP